MRIEIHREVTATNLGRETYFQTRVLDMLGHIANAANHQLRRKYGIEVDLVIGGSTVLKGLAERFNVSPSPIQPSDLDIFPFVRIVDQARLDSFLRMWRVDTVPSTGPLASLALQEYTNHVVMNSLSGVLQPLFRGMLSMGEHLTPTYDLVSGRTNGAEGYNLNGLSSCYRFNCNYATSRSITINLVNRYDLVGTNFNDIAEVYFNSMDMSVVECIHVAASSNQVSRTFTAYSDSFRDSMQRGIINSNREVTQVRMDKYNRYLPQFLKDWSLV